MNVPDLTKVRKHTCKNCPLSEVEGDARFCHADPPHINPILGYRVIPAKFYQPPSAKAGELEEPEAHVPELAGFDVRFRKVNDKMWCGRHPALAAEHRAGLIAS